MEVRRHKDYNVEYPEAFTWGWVDSQKLGDIASIIVNYIEADLKTKDRNYTPGLRAALRIIADVAEV